MVQVIFIGVAAGLAAALLFLAPIGGSEFAFPLFALAGLPIAIAGLGWGYLAAAVAAVAGGGLILVVIPSTFSFLVFMVLFGAPITWLTRLIGLWREGEGGRQWYPLGRILLHASLAVAGAVAVVGVLTGYQAEGLIRAATSALVEFFAASPSSEPPPTAEEIAPFVTAYVALMPAMVGLLMVAIVVLDLWVAALVVRASSRLERPRDSLSSVVPPNEILIGAAAAIVLAFLPGAFGQVAQVFAGAFVCALFLVGLAVLHATTVGMGGRPAILFATYAVTFFSGLPIVLFALLGAGENFLHLRARKLGRKSKPD